MIWINIALLFWIAFLNWARGYHWRPLGIALITFTFASYFAITLHLWWLFLAIGIPTGVCLGLHDHNRGVWCSLVALGISFALLVSGHLAWYWFIAYCGGNFLLGWIINNPKIVGEKLSQQKYIDPITGMGFASIFFMV